MLKKITLQGEQKKVLFLPPTNPILIKGVAGSGKTTVALYRAKHLLETQSNLFQETKIVIFTYNKTLAAYIKAISPYINGGYQKESEELDPKTPDGLNVQIINFHSWAYHFIGIGYGQTIMQWKQIEIIEQIIINMTSEVSNILNKSPEFFQEEISWIKGKIFESINDYIEAKRIGRGTSDRVTKIDKEVIWEVYQKYSKELNTRNVVDFDDYAILALSRINKTTNFIPPFTHIIIDEAQDLNKAQILTISKLVSDETNSLSIIADAAQRIYKSGFVWSEVGINIRGRTIRFETNYRNTIPVVKAALSLLSREKDTDDFTEVKQARKGGEKPKIGYFSNIQEQFDFLIEQLLALKNNDEISSTVILHRTNKGVKNIKDFLLLKEFGVEIVKSNQSVNYSSDDIKICTMSSIKGLEFNNVIILDLNDDIIPYPPGFIEQDDELHISTERRLLYTCMTRTRNNLFLFSSGEPSRYLKEIDKALLDDISTNTKSKTEEDNFPF